MMWMNLAPVLWVLVMTLLLRRPPVQAALSGVVVVGALWGLGVGVPFAWPLLGDALRDAAVLFASVAAVMLPGLLLVVLLARTPANAALGDWVRALGLPVHRQVLLIVLGIAPLLEAMTGFGVSLMATVPLLLSLFARDKALKMALTGMAIMPWGTLGLATITAAALLAVDADALAAQSALVSAPVFTALALLAVGLAGCRRAAVWGDTALAAAGFVACLYAASRWIGAEIAGVCAGCAMTAWLVWRRPLPWPRAAWPYALLFAAVIALKLLGILTGWDQALVWQGAQSAWRPLTSPGIPLLLVCMVLWRRDAPQGLLRAWWTRAQRPVLTIGGFLLMSQVMVKGGFLLGWQQALSGLNDAALTAAAALTGALGGYMTGSAVGGNVLMMPALGGGTLEAAAVMNSATGHAALGSLPMVAVLCGLAKASPAEEAALLRFAVGLALCNTVLVMLAGMVVS